MNSIRFLQLGWVIAAAMIAVTVAEGFQAPVIKIGVVDVTRVIEQSDFGKTNQEAFAKMKAAREGLMEFVDTYRMVTPEQAQRMRELGLKTNPSKEETTELDKIKATVIAARKRSTELGTKANLSPEERVQVEEFARRSDEAVQLNARWFREFNQDMQAWADREKIDSVERVRRSIQEVAKKDGYTVVLEAGVAPYGANDIFDETLKAVNDKR